MDLKIENLQHEVSAFVNKASFVPVIRRSSFGYVLFITGSVIAISAPAVAQSVNKCVNWRGAVTYQSEPCPQGQRLDRVYTPTHVDVDGRAVRNFVPSSGGSPDAFTPVYGRTMDANGRAKSDDLCEPVRAVVNGARGHRGIESLQSNARLVSQLCNHSRGPGR